MTFMEGIVFRSVNQVEISGLNVETFRLWTEWSMWKQDIKSKLTYYFDASLLLVMHPTWIASPEPLFCRDIISHVFFFFPIQPPRNTRRKFHNILFLDFSFSVGLSVCISLSLSLPLHFGRLNTPYAHPPRDHPLPFLYATIHHVIYDGRKPHSRKKKPRNKVG